MQKEFEIQGCIAVEGDISQDEFWDAFLAFIESRGWTFGGGAQEIIDGYYINADGSKGKHVFDS